MPTRGPSGHLVESPGRFTRSFTWDGVRFFDFGQNFALTVRCPNNAHSLQHFDSSVSVLLGMACWPRCSHCSSALVRSFFKRWKRCACVFVVRVSFSFTVFVFVPGLLEPRKTRSNLHNNCHITFSGMMWQPASGSVPRAALWPVRRRMWRSGALSLLSSRRVLPVRRTHVALGWSSALHFPFVSDPSTRARTPRSINRKRLLWIFLELRGDGNGAGRPVPRLSVIFLVLCSLSRAA